MQQRRNGFYWIVFASAQGFRFPPIVAWWQPDGWRVPGSEIPATGDVHVDVLAGPLAPPAA